MTLAEIKDKALSKYKVGQTFKVQLRDGKGEKIGKADVEIIKFYPHHILCKINNYHETFTYYDFLTLAMATKRKTKSKKSGHKGISWYKTNKKWVIRLWDNGKNKYIGSHKDLTEAVRIRDEYLKGVTH